MSLRAFFVLLTSFLIVGCSDNAEIKSNKKMANDFLNLALSDNPKAAQLLTHPNFTFTFMGETEISNISYDRDTYFDDWIPNVVGALLPGGITLTATDMIADKDGVALIMDGDAEGINGEYDNKYVFVYKFKEGLIHKVTEYNSDLLVATRLYKQKLMPIELTEEIEKKN